MTPTNPLKPCPDKPNCISTSSQDRRHSMLPLSFRGDREQSKSLIKKVVSTFSRTTLVREEPHYLHYTFKSLLLGFVDDVEFFWDDQSQLIHFRSASRTGYSDLGVNRKRMEKIVELYLASRI